MNLWKRTRNWLSHFTGGKTFFQHHRRAGCIQGQANMQQHVCLSFSWLIHIFGLKHVPLFPCIVHKRRCRLAYWLRAPIGWKEWAEQLPWSQQVVTVISWCLFISQAVNGPLILWIVFCWYEFQGYQYLISYLSCFAYALKKKKRQNRDFPFRDLYRIGRSINVRVWNVQVSGNRGQLCITASTTVRECIHARVITSIEFELDSTVTGLQFSLLHWYNY